MKKQFFRLSFGFCFLIMLCLIIPVSALYLLLINYLNIAEKIIAIIALILFGWEIIRLVRFRIVIDKNCVYAPDDGLGITEKIQYKTSVYFNDIVKIDIIKSKNNSLNKPILKKWLSSNVKKNYIEFILKNGEKKRIFINYYTKKQIIKIIDLIESRILENDNEVFLENGCKLYENLKKKK